MLENSIRRTPRPQDLIGMSTQELRDTFQITNLFVPGEFTGTSPTWTAWSSAA
jgi:5-keto 4-deoxyuronate isomerase